MTRPSLFAACTALCLASYPAVAQEVSYQEDLQFVQRLRSRGEHALALEYLQRLAKNASPDLAKELPLEFAKTKLAAAAEEPESTKRMQAYQQARAAFQEFLDKNPGHPRTAETNLDMAQVAIQEGRTQLSRALMQETEQARIAEAVKARTILAAAGARLETGVKQLEDQIGKLPEAKTPADKAQRAKLDEYLLHAEIARGLNYFDIAQTYVSTDTAQRAERAGQIEKARAALEKVAAQDRNNPMAWEVKAWLARCYNELGQPKKALTELASISGERTRPEAARGRRLARFFGMLVLKESPQLAEGKSAVSQIKDAAEIWMRDYPAMLKTPEGYGVQYLRAWATFSQIEALKPPPPDAQRRQMLEEVRKDLRPIEQTENDYTDEARRLKITVMNEQGLFTKPLESLTRFEECAARSQWEIYQLSEDLKKAETPADKDKKRTERQANAMKSLERGLGLEDAKPDARGKASYEVNAAKASLTYFYLNVKRYQDAIKVGEGLARSDSRAPQAPTAAMLALDAYAQMLAEREKKFETEAELKPDQDKMLDLARYMEETWKGDLPAEMARHEIGLVLLRKKKLREAIVTLSEITPSYPSYVFAQYQLAEAALQADKEKLDPLTGEDYRTRALRAFRNIPESALGADPAINQTVLLSRVRLGQELFPAKAYDEMEKIADGMLPKLDSTRVAETAAEDKEMHAKLQASLTEIKLYARLGLADTALKANQPGKVAELLDPIIDQIASGAIPDLPKNPQLGYGLIGLAVKANIALNKLDRTGAALKAMKNVEPTGGGSARVLGLLADVMRDQIDDIRKKNDTEGLKKLQDGFAAILNDLAKQETNPTAEFSYLLAKNFSNLGLHDKVTALLEKVPEPKPKESAKEVEKPVLELYHATRVLYIRSLRQSNELDKAEAALKEIMKPVDNKPNWGASNLDALLEQVLLFEDKKEFVAAANLAGQEVKALKSRVNTGDYFREKYFEFYYHVAYGTYKHGLSIRDKDKTKGDKSIQDAARQIVSLQKAWNGYGSDESAKRFQGLLEAEADLKVEVDKQTPPAKP
jgi:hypothetical protein